MDISPAVYSAVFVFGLMVGSFLNVCIWRIPAEEQVIRGRSHCRSCNKIIAGYDNIPLISFLLLRGKCRHCKAPIAWSYPAVELATGLLFVMVLGRFGFTNIAFVYALLGAALIVSSVVDWREMILPDEITLPGVSIGIILSFYVPELHGEVNRWSGLWAGVAGALVGSGLLWAVGAIGSWVFKKEAMGFGDVKLMAMVGSVLGIWKVLLVNLILAPALGAIVGLVLKFRYGRDLIPYGPFLALGTLAAIFWGDGMITWYRDLLMQGYGG